MYLLSRITKKWLLPAFWVLSVHLLIACVGPKTEEGTMTSVPDKQTWENIVGDAQVEKVAGGFQFTEGPVWISEGYLLFSDIPANIIYKWAPGMEHAEVWREPSGHSNGLTLDRVGRLIVCEHDRRVSRTESDGTVIPLAERFEDKRLNSPNDIVVKSDGSIYFTDPPYGLPEQREGKELDFNGVYRLAPDGTLTLLDDSFERPNGLAFSPDESVLYVDDSHRGHIRVFDVLPDGTLANGRVFAAFGKEPGKDGVPDGMKVDLRGNVFCTGPGGVWVFGPEGDLLGKIEPPEIPANLAWGDDDLKTLYMTARTGLYRIRVKTGGAPLVRE
jgi:sugar lactone lactonase YvrE